MPDETLQSFEQESLEAAWQKARENEPRSPATLLEPGIYFDLPAETYFSIPAINKSSMCAAKTSLAHYYFRPPAEETSAFRMGSLVHAGKLEPETLSKRYVVIPDSLVDMVQAERRVRGEEPYANPRAAKSYKQKLAAFLSQHPGKQEVSQKWFEDMQGMILSMDRCPRCRDLFHSGWPEVSIIWRDPTTNLLRKGRIDWLCENGDMVDVKTAADITSWSVEDYNYHIQASSYMEGYVYAWIQSKASLRRKYPASMNPYLPAAKKAKAVLRERSFHFCVVEKTRPYTVLCAPVDERVLRIGYTEDHFILEALARAAEQVKEVAPEDAYTPMQPPRFWTFGRYFRENDFPLYRDFVLGE